MHLALSSASDDAAFAPEPFTTAFQDSLQESFAKLASGTLGLLRARMAHVPAEYKGKAAEIAARERDILGIFRAALHAPIEAMRIRIHGDFHLGQVLYTGSDFVIIDFEGEPARPLAERRMKQSPLQDVAGMLRSFHYLAFAPLLGAGASGADSRASRLSGWAEGWSRCASNRFLGRYYETSGEAGYLPASSQERAKLLEMYLLAKAIYELGYELNNRPSWVGIPLEGIARLLPMKERA
jgi:maltose alpha-D-glucosyltransferase/alpha-amylase